MAIPGNFEVREPNVEKTLNQLANLAGQHMSETLKPCPFGCNSIPVLKHYQRGAFVTDYWVSCPICKLEIGRCGVPAEAIAAWNHRTLSPAFEAMREALRNYVNCGQPPRGVDELWSAWQSRVAIFDQARAALAMADQEMKESNDAHTR